jgi:signal peptidase II
MTKKNIFYSLRFIIIDQLIKGIITNNIVFGSSIVIINNFFEITNVSNTGAAWSILSNNVLLLIIIAILAMLIIYYLFIKNKVLHKYQALAYSTFYAGIIGNLIDRLLFGHVIDYLSFNIFGYDFPVFNMADIYIVTSMVVIIYFIYKEDKHGRI